jgi:acetyltransferase-like isoleucine patch superfamily enzyme
VHWSDSGAQLKVGNFCSFASNINIYLGGNHRTDWISTYAFGYVPHSPFNDYLPSGHPASKGDVIIGNDVWIADNVTIMSGIKIGDGAVIANNSHVVKDVEPYSIVGGNPAIHIKYRFTLEQIAKLLEIQWWNWDDAKIKMHVPYLCSDNIDDFICTEFVN